MIFTKTQAVTSSISEPDSCACNNLSTNLSQSICQGSSGAALTGDVFGVLPSGISLSGTGYQWAYGNTSTGPWTDISGATSATFTPNSLVAPFNVSGTYYVIRKASFQVQ